MEWAFNITIYQRPYCASVVARTSDGRAYAGAVLDPAVTDDREVRAAALQVAAIMLECPACSNSATKRRQGARCMVGLE